jgi:hypothetical protein
MGVGTDGDRPANKRGETPCQGMGVGMDGDRTTDKRGDTRARGWVGTDGDRPADKRGDTHARGQPCMGSKASAEVRRVKREDDVLR